MPSVGPYIDPNDPAAVARLEAYYNYVLSMNLLYDCMCEASNEGREKISRIRLYLGERYSDIYNQLQPSIS